MLAFRFRLRPKSGFGLVVCVLAAALFHAPVRGDTLLVAVAANFATPMAELGEEFRRNTGHELRLTSASSGVQYAQIVNGAPFDLFFSADAQRPQLLEEQGLIVAGSRFSYAIGQLVLWSADPHLVDSEGAVLRSGNFQHLALADPDSAPYGLAAIQTLENLGLTAAVQSKLVTGTNISQAFQFVASGAAPLGFVALSQVLAPDSPFQGSYWLVPETLHEPIDQQAVLLKDSVAGRQLINFLATETARQIIVRFGYLSPN